MPGSWNLEEIINSHDFPAVIDFCVRLYGFAPLRPGQQPCLKKHALVVHTRC